MSYMSGRRRDRALLNGWKGELYDEIYPAAGLLRVELLEYFDYSLTFKDRSTPIVIVSHGIK